MATGLQVTWHQHFSGKCQLFQAGHNFTSTPSQGVGASLRIQYPQLSHTSRNLGFPTILTCPSPSGVETPLNSQSSCNFDSHPVISRETFWRLLRFGGRKECRAFIFTFETQLKHTASQPLVQFNYSDQGKVCDKWCLLCLQSLKEIPVRIHQLFLQPILNSCNIRTERAVEIIIQCAFHCYFLESLFPANNDSFQPSPTQFL